MLDRYEVFAMACVFFISLATYFIGWWALLSAPICALIVFVWEGSDDA